MTRTSASALAGADSLVERETVTVPSLLHPACRPATQVPAVTDRTPHTERRRFAHGSCIYDWQCARVPATAARRPAAVPVTIAACAALALALRAYQLSRPGYLLGVTEYDDGVLFGNALRLVSGVIPYRDFAMVQPPGSALLMVPVALLATVTGTAWGLAIARILTVCADTANVVLLGVLVRHRGPVTGRRRVRPVRRLSGRAGRGAHLPARAVAEPVLPGRRGADLRRRPASGDGPPRRAAGVRRRGVRVRRDGQDLGACPARRRRPGGCDHPGGRLRGDQRHRLHRGRRAVLLRCGRVPGDDRLVRHADRDDQRAARAMPARRWWRRSSPCGRRRWRGPATSG